MNPRNVCLIGGSGFVGAHIAHLLSKQGIGVRVPTRRRERAKHLLVLPTVEVVEAQVHDPDQLDQLLTGMDAVINLAGILHGDFAATHIELPRKIVAACQRNRVRRLVHMSALHAGADAPSAYLRSKAAGEEIVCASGLLTTVFRPSVIFGEGDAFLNLFADLSCLPILPLAKPDAKFQPVHVGDVAQAFVACLNRPATFGQRFDVCGPRVYTLRQLVEYAAHLRGQRPLIVGLNDALSYLQALMMEYLPGKLMTRDNFYSMRQDSICSADSCAKFAAAFRLRLTALETVAPAYLAGHTPRQRYFGFRSRTSKSR